MGKPLLNKVGFITSGESWGDADWEDPSVLPGTELLPLQLLGMGSRGPGWSVPVVNPNHRQRLFPLFLPLGCFLSEL